MATFEEEAKIRETLRESLEKLAQIDVDGLVRIDELGKALSFEPGLQSFRRVLNLFQEVRSMDLDLLGHSQLSNINNQATDAITIFDKIKDFSPHGHENPGNVRDDLIAQIRDHYDSYLDVVAPILALARTDDLGLTKMMLEARDKLSELEESRSHFENEKQSIMEEMQSTLSTVRSAAAEVGVAQHANHFRHEAEGYLRSSTKWLFGTIAMALVTLAWGIGSFWVGPRETNMTISIIAQYTIPKLIVLSVLYFALVWCARNYGAHRHNYVVNKHRQNALSTFEAFVKASGDDVDTKNAVLLQATQSIFSSQSSGFVQKEVEPGTSNKIIEILRMAAPQKSSD